MKIAVLSCFDIGNRQTCSKQGASRFPTLKIFPAKSKHGRDGEALITGGKDIFDNDYEIHRLVNVMIDRVVNFQKKNHSDWWEDETPDLTLHKNIEAIQDLAILEQNEAIDIDQMFTPSAVSVGAQLAISDPSRAPETLPDEVIKVKKIYTFKLTMGSEVSGFLRC